MAARAVRVVGEALGQHRGEPADRARADDIGAAADRRFGEQPSRVVVAVGESSGWLTRR
jgi:hypothetical protein